MAKLSNERHERFCNLYVFGSGRPPKDFEKLLTPEELAQLPAETMENGAQSYRAAGYSCKRTSLYQGAAQLLRRADIQVRIKELRDEKEQADAAGHVRIGSLVPLADRAIQRALISDDERTAFMAAKFVKELYAGPLKVAFGADKNGGGKVKALPVMVLAYDDSDGPPEP